MKKAKKWATDNLPILIVLFVGLLCAGFIIFGTTADNGSITLDGQNAKIEEYTEEFIENANKALIEYSEEEVPATIITDEGEETLEVPTVESVDGGEVPDEEETNGEDGRGAWHDTTTYWDYYKSVGLNTCINNSFGAQCFALANDFWQNYAGRALSSCGTGAAKGTLKCYAENAGDDFVMVWNAKDLQPGDWVVFNSGTWGHIGMAMGYYNNGYISLFGQNQGGGYCAKGGAATNVINISLSSFGGAFRPKSYVKPEPKPEPTPTGEVTYTYVKGDYFSKVLVKLGLDEGHLWGSNGTVAYYTAQLIEQDVLDSRGNVKIGVPFTLTAR